MSKRPLAPLGDPDTPTDRVRRGLALLLLPMLLAAAVGFSAARASASSVTINVGDDVQSVVNSYGEGTTFFFAPGTHYGVNVTPKDGQSFTATEGTVVLDGQGSTVPAFASWRRIKDVTISNLEITNYAPGAFVGVVDAASQTWSAEEWSPSLNWRLINLNIHHNKGSLKSTAVHVGSGIEVRSSDLKWNNGTGIYGNGRDIIIDGNKVLRNSRAATSDAELLYHSGGMKLVAVQNVVVSNNQVNKNKGPGIWFDVNADNVTIDNNRAWRNTYTGIHYEISRNADIRNNTVTRNGYADKRGWMHAGGITISSSHDVVIENNTLHRNAAGVAVFDQRTLRAAEGGQSSVPGWARLTEGDGSDIQWRTSNVMVRNNTIRGSGVSGASATNVQSVNSDIYDTTVFTGNSFRGATERWWGTGDELAQVVEPSNWSSLHQ